MLWIVAVVLSLLGTMSMAAAQPWPSKPVKIVVPYPAGGGTDIVARLLAERLSDSLGQRVIVENKPGAGGMIGADNVAKSAPDGYTLLVSSPAEIVINGYIFPRMTYDAQVDFAPISLLAITPLIIAAHPSANIASLQDLLAQLAAKPGKLNYSTPGVGSAHHLAGEYLKKTAAVDMLHIAYKGAAPAVQDAVSGQVMLTISGLPTVMAHIKAGALKPVAVTSAKRAPTFPGVVALAELGDKYRDLDINNWFGFFAPAGVAKDIIEKLRAATVKALSAPLMQERLAQQGAEAVGNSPEEFRAFINAEAAKYARISAVTGIKADP